MAGNALAADHDLAVQHAGRAARARSSRRRDGPLGDALADSARRGRHEVPLRPRTATSPRCASTSSRTTPARTSATCGRPAASCSPRSSSRTRRPRAGSRRRCPSPVAIAKDTTYVTSVLRRATGRFAFSPGYFALRRRPPAAARAGRLAGRRQRRLPLRRRAASPTETFNATNYWVDAVFEPHPPAGHARAAGRAPSPGRRRHAACRRRARSTATFDEPLDPLTVNAGSISSRTARATRCRHGHLRRGDPQGDADAVAAARARQDLHGDASRAAPPASPTWPATSSPPTRRGRSARRAAVPVHGLRRQRRARPASAVQDQPLEVG